MRDLVLAKTFKNAAVSFACQDLPGNINQRVLDVGYSLYILKSDSLDELVTLITELKTDMLVIDHYGIDHTDETHLRTLTGVRLFVLDDTYEQHECHILLNHNAYADATQYEGLVPADCELRCGSAYTLLRDEFKDIKAKKLTKESRKVFVAMGGADTKNLNTKILNILEELHLKAVVVTTKGNKHLNELKTYVQNKESIELHINASNVAELMAKSAFAIVTPSVTVNEIMFMELPFIAIKTAENQRFMCEYLENKNIPVLSWFDEDKLRKLLLEIFK